MRPKPNGNQDNKSPAPDSDVASTSANGSAAKSPNFDVRDALAHTKTIVPNEKSRRYSLSEMFEILRSMEANNELIPQKSNENYRYSKPTNILHVVLNSNQEDATTSTDPEDVSSQSNNLNSVSNIEAGSLINADLHNLSLNGANAPISGWDSVSQQPVTSNIATGGGGGDEGNATAVAALSSTNSPAINPTSLLERISSKSLLNSVHSPHNAPPGLFTVPPDKINWYYLDPSNQEQGPFNGTLMHNWYSQGYLPPDLQIRRAEESNHTPLNQFINRVQNSLQPFLVPLPVIVSSFHQSGTAPSTAQSPFNQFSDAPSLHSVFFNNAGGTNGGTASPALSHTSNFFHNQGNVTGASTAAPATATGAPADPGLLDNSLTGVGTAGATPASTTAAGGSGFQNISANGWGTPRSNLIQQTWSNNGYRPALNNSSLTNLNASQEAFNLGETLPGSSRLGNQSPFYNHAPLSVSNSFTNVNVVQQPAGQQSALSVQNTGNSFAGTGANSLFSNHASPIITGSKLFGGNAGSIDPQQSQQQQQQQKQQQQPLVIDQDHISSLLLGSVLKDDDFDKVVESAKPDSIIAAATNESPASPKQAKVTADQQEELKSKAAAATSNKNKEEASKKSKKDKKKNALTQELASNIAAATASTIPTKDNKKSSISDMTTSTTTANTTKKTQSPVIEKLVPATSTRSNLAPWAKTTTSTDTKKDANGKPLTLKEIQQMEAAEKAKQEKLLEQQRAAQRDAFFKEALSEEQEQQKQAAAAAAKKTLPGTAGWASVAQGKNTLPTKTLLDIQREEAAKKRSTANAANSAAISSVSGPKGATFASVANEKYTTDSNNSSWTVVAGAPKKPTGAPKVQMRVTTSNASKVQTPSQLRSVSATGTAGPAVANPSSSSSYLYSSNSNNANNKQRREFLAWCRAELRDLNRGVNKEELLRMFFQFPCSTDSRDLISDTIYSSSKIINGRRFADEFIKRRRTVEKFVSNWDDALNMDPDNEEEDEWTTTTSKKKNRR